MPTCSSRWLAAARCRTRPPTSMAAPCSAILAEAMAWATIAVVERCAVTREMTTSFARPVRLGRDYAVEAGVTDVAVDLTTWAGPRRTRPRVRIGLSATFAPVGAADARRMLGQEATGTDRELLADD